MGMLKRRNSVMFTGCTMFHHVLSEHLDLVSRSSTHVKHIHVKLKNHPQVGVKAKLISVTTTTTFRFLHLLTAITTSFRQGTRVSMPAAKAQNTPSAHIVTYPRGSDVLQSGRMLYERLANLANIFLLCSSVHNYIIQKLDILDLLLMVQKSQTTTWDV